MAHTHMSMTRMMNFDKFAVGYVNDNLEYINNAEEAVQHITDSRKYDETATPLTDEEVERFKYVAETLFKRGYVAHAGSLKSYPDEEEEKETFSGEQFVTANDVHTHGYDAENGEFCLGLDGIELDGTRVENLYIFFTDEQMEEIISSYKKYKKRK